MTTLSQPVPYPDYKSDCIAYLFIYFFTYTLSESYLESKIFPLINEILKQWTMIYFFIIGPITFFLQINDVFILEC